MPFDDASFDATLLVTIFGEIEGLQGILAEAVRVSPPPAADAFWPA